MSKSTIHASVLLLTITSLTVTQGQYYDIFQGFTQLFQPYPQNFNPSYFQTYDINANRQDNRKKNEEVERTTKKSPTNQYDYVFSTTTPKPNRKSTKSSQKNSNRHLNSGIIFSDLLTHYEATTKRSRTKTTTKSTTQNFYYPTTENYFSNNFDNSRLYENRKIESENIVFSNDRPTNTRNPNVHNINNKLNFNTFNNNIPKPINDNNRPSNSRNPSVYPINQTQKPIRPNFSNHNPNRGVPNTDFNENVNYNNGRPLINMPGVKPAPIDVNQPPITNKPVENYNFVTQRPVFNTERSAESPKVMVGPDEDQMSEAQKRRLINLAEKMCETYKGLNVKQLVALPLLPSPDPVAVNVSSCVPIDAPLIIGGRVATIEEFPHMALVGWRKIRDAGYSWKCGGSLISDRYVLSAGHCMFQDKDYDVDSGPPQAVQLGSSYLNDPGALVVKIEAVIYHPKYKQLYRYYDIALLKMAQAVTFSEVIKPACLGVPPPAGQKIIATGWGRTEFGGDHSIELRSVSLPVWNMTSCREVWGAGESRRLPQGPTADSHLCAGEAGKDTCQGDSGGPAQIQDGCVWRVIAVTSYGRSCGAPHTPALYALTKRAFIAAQVFGSERDNTRDHNRREQDGDRQNYGSNRDAMNRDYNRREQDSDRPVYGSERDSTRGSFNRREQDRDSFDRREQERRQYDPYNINFDKQPFVVNNFRRQ